MNILILVAIPIVILVVIAVLFLAGLKGRGKLIVCPECGTQFKRPAFAEKVSGLGYSFPGIGDYTCPKCKHRANTRDFAEVNSESK